MESISKIKLKNQAGAITMLKGYVKVASDSEAYYKCGASDNFDVGQSGMIDLNDHIGDAEKKQSRKDGYIFPGDLVTAYAAISAHSDVYGSTWLTYDPHANRTAVFILSGALWDLNVAFEGFE